MVRSITFFVLLLLGCSGSQTQSPCGANGRYAEQGAQAFCAYGVIVGGFRCPAFTPYAVPGFGNVCSNRPFAILNPATCTALNLSCLADAALADANVGDTGAPDSSVVEPSGGETQPCLAELLATDNTRADAAYTRMLGSRCDTNGEVCGVPCSGQRALICNGVWHTLNAECTATPNVFPCAREDLGGCRTDQYCYYNCALPSSLCLPLPEACRPGSDCTCLNPRCHDTRIQDVGYSGRVADPNMPNSGLSSGTCS